MKICYSSIIICKKKGVFTPILFKTCSKEGHRFLPTF